MRSAYVTRRQAEAMTDGFDMEDVFAVQEAVSMRFEREELRRAAEVDRLLQDVEHKLVTAQRIEADRQRLNASDQQSPRRSRRRTDRVALRSLPMRLPVSVLTDLDSEAA
jgi:hypothetical protein